MSRRDGNAVEAALCLAAILLALMLITSVTGCASAPVALHSWSDGRSPWIDYGDRCDANCSI